MPSINFTADDIKPLLSTLGLGDAKPSSGPGDPSAAQPPIPFISAPPGPPPPTPAAAGFGPWLADPQNQQKVADGITVPGEPLMPQSVPPGSPLGSNMPPPQGGNMASVNPPPARQFAALSPPPLPTSAPTQQQSDQTSRNLFDAANASTLARKNFDGDWKKSGLFGLAAGLVGAAGGLNGNPLAGVQYVQGLEAQDRSVGAENDARYRNATVQPLLDAQQLKQGDASLQQTAANTTHIDAETAALNNKPDKPQTIEEQAYDYAVKQGKSPMDALAAVYQSKSPVKAEKDAGLPQQYLDAIASGDSTKAGLIKQVIHDTQVQPKIDIHQANAPAGSSGTWQMVMDKDGNPKFWNSKTGEMKDNAQGLTKPKGDRATVDEQKRADLAKNMNENLDSMEDIVRRRPELFGPLAGRFTGAKQSFGTDDPDIARMETIKHNLGMVAQGTHGMRSATGIETAANSLLNGFHNSPKATLSALEAGRSSSRTFLDDANNPGKSRGAGITPPPAGGSGVMATHAYNPATGKIEVLP